MKSLKQLREQYDNNVLPQNSEVLVLEDKKGEVAGKSLSPIPSPSAMPNLLMFRRVTYRMYPNKQVVALYYSKSVDKYLSIPFGPTGNLNLSEASIYDTIEQLDLEEGAKWEATKGGLKGAVQGAMKGFYVGSAIAAEPGIAVGTPVGAAIGAYKGAKKAYQKAKEKEKDMNEDWSDVKHQNPSGGLKKSGVMAYRRENPGSKLQTAVTTKPSKLKPGSKAANRRKSFCARMGGMKKRLTSAKTANDPDSRINKALRKWNCEESFKAKLQEKRMQREGVADYLDAGAEAVVPYYSAGKKLYKGDYKGAATDAAVDTALLATGAVAGKVLAGGAKLAGKGLGKIASKLSKTPKTKVPGKAPRKAAPTPKSGRGSSALDAASELLRKSQDDKSSQTTDNSERRLSTDISKPKAKIHTPEFRHGGETAVDTARKNALVRKEYETSKKQVQENKISDLRDMLNEVTNLHEITINGRTVTLNSSMAKRIIEVYDSVNTKNKKIVEGMLNEDLESFKRLLNFSIRN